jgi:hypothetical protein
MKLILHLVALLIEAIGTLFILLDTYRISELAKEIGHSDAGDEPAALHPWYFHSAVPGFGLLFAGMLLAGIILLIEHWQQIHEREHLHSEPPRAPY